MDGTNEARNGQASKSAKVFAPRIIRILADVEAAKSIEIGGCFLIAYIISRQDQFGYERPYECYASQLCRELGISDNTLRTLVKKCVTAGWLHVQRKSIRDVTKYWVTIPHRLPDHLKDYLSDYLKICGSHCGNIRTLSIPDPKANPNPKEIARSLDKNSLAKPDKKPSSQQSLTPEDRPSFCFILKGGDEWWLSQGKLEEYKSTYSMLDVESVLRKVAQWTRDNEKKRKTARGMHGFLNGWLSRQKPENLSPTKPKESAARPKPLKELTEQEQAAFGIVLKELCETLEMNTRDPAVQDIAREAATDEVHATAVRSLLSDLTKDEYLKSNKGMLRGTFFKKLPGWVSNTRDELAKEEQRLEKVRKQQADKLLADLTAALPRCNTEDPIWHEYANKGVRDSSFRKALLSVFHSATEDQLKNPEQHFKHHLPTAHAAAIEKEAALAAEIKAERQKLSKRDIEAFAKGTCESMHKESGIFYRNGCVIRPDGSKGRWK